MKPKEYDSLVNPSFHLIEWVWHENCIARISIDKVGLSSYPPGYKKVDWELFDGERWLSVMPEVFYLFLRLGNAEVPEHLKQEELDYWTKRRMGKV